MRISVVGAGYVGLVSAVCLSERGYNVFLCDRDRKKIRLIKKGTQLFYEPGLEKLLKNAIASGKMQVLLSTEEAVLNSDITFITVGTPSNPDGSINLAYIENLSQEMGEALMKKEEYHLVAVRSSVVPGTTENVVKPAIEKKAGKRAGKDFGLAMQPEFLREGSAVQDTFNPNRVIIGQYDEKSGDTLEDLWLEFYKENVPPILRMNLATAEMVKYASNAFLAARISFINELANLCERVRGVDITTVAKGMGYDERIGKKFLNAGLGFGGSCFPKDVKALITFSKQIGYKPIILQGIMDVNEKQALHSIDLMKEVLGDLRQKKVAILGLAFKPNTDDMREAPSIRIINQLLKEHASVTAYDPVAIENAKSIFARKIRYASSAVGCLSNADCCIIVTEWDEFKGLKPKDFIDSMKHPVIIDGRKIYDPLDFSRKLKYLAIGLASM